MNLTAPCILVALACATVASADVTLTSRNIRWTITPSGMNAAIALGTDKRSVLDKPGTPFAVARKGEAWSQPTSATMDGGVLKVAFGASGLAADFKVESRPEGLVVTVANATGDPDEVAFCQARLTLKGTAGEPNATCLLARNLNVNVDPIPGPSTTLGANTFKRTGVIGASVAVVAGPYRQFRAMLKLALLAAPDLPHSPIGGPWALESRPNHNSYLFNFAGLNVASAPKWISMAQSVGARQIDFHGGGSFRFGDFVPDKETYPRGRPDLKATIDALHAGGIQAGLHTYAFFIDKRSPYVTPVPDPRLASLRTLTLAQPIDAAATTITVNEPTEGLGTTTGFFVVNSTTLRIGTELVTFGAVSQSPPWQFTGCTRGALGTRAQAHGTGEKADHLKELFGYFAPDGDSTLFTEVARNTADMYNECGFDMIYLDALDGSYILAGGEWAWYYGGKFVYEIFKHLKKAPIIEMSTFHHNLWCVRARMGAWDASHTGYKEFIDMHRVVNHLCDNMYLPTILGWWGVFPWNGIQPDATMPDDLEYLLCKSLADDAGLAFVQGFSPDTFDKSPGAQRQAAMIRKYEDLRAGGKVPARIRAMLGTPMAEYSLVERGGKRAFVPRTYRRVAIEGAQGDWSATHPAGTRARGVRIEARLGVGQAPTDRTPLLPVDAELVVRRAADGVKLEITPATTDGGPGGACRRLVATSTRPERKGAWAMAEHIFATPLNLELKGQGVWIKGDGSGAVLNFQLRSPENVTPGVSEHYLRLDFTGWRYVELIEPESETLSRYTWPYAGARTDWEKNPGLANGSAYKLHHPWTVYSAIGALAIWVNDVPAGGKVDCLVGQVDALKLVPCTIEDPSVAMGGSTITFPTSLESGKYLEWWPGSDACVYGPHSEFMRSVKPVGSLPAPVAGDEVGGFACGSAPVPPRARVTIISEGAPIRF